MMERLAAGDAKVEEIDLLEEVTRQVEGHGRLQEAGL